LVHAVLPAGDVVRETVATAAAILTRLGSAPWRPSHAIPEAASGS
jgi:hypothetical protein